MAATKASARALAVLGVLSALYATTAAGVARAEGPKPTPAQEAEAEALFQRARARVLQGDFAAACPLFEESYQLAGGGGTAQNLATCYEDLGKLALAHKTFVALRRASVASGREDRVRLCDEHIVKLELRLARLRVRVPPQSRVPGMKILVDSEEPDEPTRTAGVLVDPGLHVVRVTAPGKAAIELQRVVPREGAIEVVDVPPLRASADGPQPDGPPSDKKDDRLAAREATRVVGFAVGGAGLDQGGTQPLVLVLAAVTPDHVCGLRQGGHFGHPGRQPVVLHAGRRVQGQAFHQGTVHRDSNQGEGLKRDSASAPGREALAECRVSSASRDDAQGAGGRRPRVPERVWRAAGQSF